MALDAAEHSRYACSSSSSTASNNACLVINSTVTTTCRPCVTTAVLHCAAVSSKVHELVGGVVEHRGVDETDLPDDTKLLQRLYSLNIMRLEGLEPDVNLWTVRVRVVQQSVALHQPQAVGVLEAAASSYGHMAGGSV